MRIEIVLTGGSARGGGFHWEGRCWTLHGLREAGAR